MLSLTCETCPYVLPIDADVCVFAQDCPGCGEKLWLTESLPNVCLRCGSATQGLFCSPCLVAHVAATVPGGGRRVREIVETPFQFLTR